MTAAPVSSTERTRIRVRRKLGLPIKPPRGWRTGPPDFVGVGAQRSGTSWWFRQLRMHPAVVAPWGKERHYFDPYGEEDFGPADAEGYARLFPRPAGALTGEWTPRYMHDPWSPRLLSECAPRARVLVLLRDPWARFLSGVRHETRVLARELRGRRGDYLRLLIRHDALQRSLYAGQLANLLAHFDRAQVLVLQYERCVADPRAELERTVAFLGLDPAPQEVIESRPSAAGGADPPLPAGTVAEARALLAADAARLAELVPEVDLELWPSVRPEASPRP